ASAAHDLLAAGGLEESLAAWLAGDELAPVERYLARASLYAPLVALEADAGAACANDPSPRGGRRSPRCGRPPQLSFRSGGAALPLDLYAAEHGLCKITPNLMGF